MYDLLHWDGGRGGGEVGGQLLVLSPKMLKFKIQIFTGGWLGEGRGRGGLVADF